MSPRRWSPKERDCPWQPLIDWVDTEMRARQIKPVDVHQGAGIPFSTLSGILNCVHRPTLDNLDKLARYFGRPLDEVRALAGAHPAGPDRSQPVPFGLQGNQLQELGWSLYDLWPHLSVEERQFLLDYIRLLQQRKGLPAGPVRVEQRG